MSWSRTRILAVGEGSWPNISHSINTSKLLRFSWLLDLVAWCQGMPGNSEICGASSVGLGEAVSQVRALFHRETDWQGNQDLNLEPNVCIPNIRLWIIPTDILWVREPEMERLNLALKAYLHGRCWVQFALTLVAARSPWTFRPSPCGRWSVVTGTALWVWFISS